MYYRSLTSLPEPRKTAKWQDSARPRLRGTLLLKVMTITEILAMIAKTTPSASQIDEGMYSSTLIVMCLAGWLTAGVMLLDITRTVIVRTHRVVHGMRRCADVDLKCVVSVKESVDHFSHPSEITHQLFCHQTLSRRIYLPNGLIVKLSESGRGLSIIPFFLVLLVCYSTIHFVIYLTTSSSNRRAFVLDPISFRVPS